MFIEQNVADCNESVFQDHCDRRAKMFKRKGENCRPVFKD